MADKIHRYESGRDFRDQGQTEFEYRNSTVCGYVRKIVTREDSKVTCKLCLKIMNQK